MKIKISRFKHNFKRVGIGQIVWVLISGGYVQDTVAEAFLGVIRNLPDKYYQTNTFRLKTGSIWK